MTPLSSKRRSELRAEAHKLSPIVIIGDKGLTDEVLAEVDRALKAHELIKVRAATDDRDARNVWMESICGKLQAHPVQQIGKVLVVFRENPKEAKPKPKMDSRPLPPRGGAGNDGDQRRAGNDAEKRRAGNDGDQRRAGNDAEKRRAGNDGDQRRAGNDDGRKETTATRKRRTRDDVKRTSRPRSRTPSPLPASGPRRRRPRTSR
jgi:putative YhbY family RNA-binding protein